MSDHQDRMKEKVARGLSSTYVQLVAVCAALPLPIALPMDATVSTVEVAPAVRRAVELVSEQPLSGEQQAEMAMALTMWLAALDLHRVNVAEYEETRTIATLAILVSAVGAIHDVITWQQGGGS
ncbi:hypothetical protein [Streptomyces sp. SID3212]|uniref:hypothetical protein n=1 Tax=Streptomyces sp. SID3212 TaxID=2690259 RepID=UPI001368870A|nr:hypothetical protein [Streptomyces sp. SID3212]MYV53129.1 hypothetical protein [Streptomyces sp. SID3212]